MSFAFTNFASVADLTAAVTDCLVGVFARATDKPLGVMLSGGRTPLAAYTEVARRGQVAGEALRICYSDERDVPAASPESNYGATLPMLTALQLPGERVLRVRTELGWHEAAERYDQELNGFLASGGRVALGLLGLGADGHTASLFTSADVASGGGRFAIAVGRPRKPDRISVTPAFLARIERVIILASGDDKRDVLGRLASNPGDVVAGVALRGLPSVEVWQA